MPQSRTETAAEQVETYLENVAGDDIAREYRERALMFFCFCLPPFVLPFSILSFLQDRPIMGVLTVVVVSASLLDAIALVRGRRMPLPVPVLFGFVLLTVLYAFELIGVPATYWCYPAPLIFIFVEKRTVARVMAGVFLLSVIPLAFWRFDLAVASRFAVTLAMVCIFSEVLVNLVVELQGKLTQLARIDPLTGAYNRRHLDEALRGAVAAVRRGGAPASLVGFDIDHFKVINDSRGHDVGDRVLRDLAELVRDAQREVDTLFRTGGEEFVVLLPSTPTAGGLVFAESLRKKVEQASLLVDGVVTISLGVAEYQAGESESDWLKRTDEQLYTAKHEGRNCVRPVVS